MSTNATILKLLDLSTRHITEATCNTWLPTEKARDGVEPLASSNNSVFTYTPPIAFYEKGDQGWFVHVPGKDMYDDDQLEEELERVPSDLMVVIKYARELDVQWLQFDCDADTNGDLPVFEW